MQNLEDAFDASYQSTSKKIDLHAPEHHQHNCHGEPELFDGEINISQMSNDDLYKVLAFMEGELEAREDVIDRLKRDRTKLLLAEAKYGKLSANDPFSALRRDSEITNEIIDEGKIAKMYESQVTQLEKLIAVQKKSQHSAVLLLAALDKKHYKLVRKLEADKNAKIKYAKQGDDLVAHLEKERSHLNQQIQFHIEEKRKAEIEKDKMEIKLSSERKRHESIVLYLIQERKAMLIKMHELRVNLEQFQQQQQHQAGTSNSVNDRELIEDMKKELTFLRSERESLMRTQKVIKSENASLKETVRGQEADLSALRKNLMSSAPKHPPHTATILPQLAADSCSLIVANRGATSAQIRHPVAPTGVAPSMSIPSRLSTSSSFPMEKSRLPRGPPVNSATVPRTNPGNVSSASSSSRTMSSPVKKNPAMGVSSTTVRRPQSSSASLVSPAMISQTGISNPNATLSPELEQLEAAIQSMNVTGSAGNSMVKRSTSLPREKNNNPAKRRTMVSTTIRNGGNISASGVVTTRIAAPPSSSANERKLSGTVKRNGILAKAFGSTK